MATWTTVANAFCPTGKGGGSDNSCGKGDGGQRYVPKGSAEDRGNIAHKLSAKAEEASDKAKNRPIGESGLHLHAEAATHHENAAQAHMKAAHGYAHEAGMVHGDQTRQLRLKEMEHRAKSEEHLGISKTHYKLSGG